MRSEDVVDIMLFVDGKGWSNDVIKRRRVTAIRIRRVKVISRITVVIRRDIPSPLDYQE